jgi:hypothetical protein
MATRKRPDCRRPPPRPLFIPDVMTLRFAIALSLACCLCSSQSAAEVRSSGTADHAVVQVSDATLPEILASLNTTFNLKVTLKGTATGRYTGAFSGTVRQVLSRLLADDDFVLQSTSDGLNIILVGKSAADSAARYGLPMPRRR